MSRAVRVLCLVTAAACVALAGCDDDTGTARDGGPPSDGPVDRAGDGKADTGGDLDQAQDTGGGADQAPDTTAMDQAQDTGGVDQASDTGTDTGRPVTAASYEVAVTLRPDPARPAPMYPPNATLPASDRFTLYVDTDGGRPRLVASRGGVVGLAALARMGDGWGTTEDLRLGPAADVGGACSGFGSFRYRIEDIRFDSGGVTAAVHGSGSYVQGDVVAEVPFVGTLAGTRDHSPPIATFRVPTPHPMDQVRVLLSETLPGGLRAALLADGGLRVELDGDISSPDTFKAAFWSKIALRPATSYRLAIEPALVDLAANVSTAPAITVTTAAVPLIPEDGFEGTTAPLLQGAAAIVDASKAPPIAGARSLLIPPISASRSARFSARLAVEAGDRFVRATLRPALSQRTWRMFYTGIRLAARDGAPVTRMLAEAADPVTCTGSGATEQCYAAPVPLEIPLPAGTTGEVMIDVNRDLGCGLVPPEPGFLLDDLRVE
jgi:hypothetical protein